HVKAGVPPLRAIHSATGLAAQVIGLGEVTGTLEAGKDADVIAVEGDPLHDITAMSRVAFVMARGRVVTAPRDARPATHSESVGSLARTRRGTRPDPAPTGAPGRRRAELHPEAARPVRPRPGGRLARVLRPPPPDPGRPRDHPGRGREPPGGASGRPPRVRSGPPAPRPVR